MSSQEIIKRLRLGEGARMEIIIDHALPEDAIERVTILNYSENRPGSVFHVPAHWHKHHSEYITIHEGRCMITLDGKTRIVHADDPDPTVYIPAWHTHSMQGFEGEKLVLQERADPAGLYKAEFFNDMMSQGSMPGFWHAMRAFYDGDTWVALPGNIGIVDQAFTLVFGTIAKLIESPKATL
ncbi:hypothetical protein B0J12DRAFT_772673 [Macrophomina phaseolina]|uniref:Cupin type-2 domain-containing protein n=1 Tax=Macrophomina phaseolina TaxID=35725 RepID=A0ABQ8GN38_9PEZI|nr:hypothetical protein B0J12DRAFT_772673 [Macrophomina phaseolina]